MRRNVHEKVRNDVFFIFRARRFLKVDKNVIYYLSFRNTIVTFSKSDDRAPITNNLNLFNLTRFMRDFFFFNLSTIFKTFYLNIKL